MKALAPAASFAASLMLAACGGGNAATPLAAAPMSPGVAPPPLAPASASCPAGMASLPVGSFEMGDRKDYVTLIMTSRQNNRALVPTDAELLEEFDQLVVNATHGDRRAVAAIAVAFYPVLAEHARDELGPALEHLANDAVQDFFLDMCEEKLVFPAIRGGAIPWLKRSVREIARRYLRDRPPPRIAG